MMICRCVEFLADMSIRAVFLDKDGTLVEDVPYNVDLNLQLTVEVACISAVSIVITNQSGVARATFQNQRW